jgi:C_GCAxxG_C_C family probable redox protein
MVLPEPFDPAERGERARNCFLEGYNCCQAVLLAFTDVLEANGLASEELLKTIGSGFGGGFARMREVCGSFSACTMLAGFLRPAGKSDMDARTANYALVQEMAADFRERNGGSIVCGELLGLRPAPSRAAGLNDRGAFPPDPLSHFVPDKSAEKPIADPPSITPARREQEGPRPSERTPEYYKKRPCPEIIRNAATIAAEKMKEAAR